MKTFPIAEQVNIQLNTEVMDHSFGGEGDTMAMKYGVEGLPDTTYQKLQKWHTLPSDTSKQCRNNASRML